MGIRIITNDHWGVLLDLFKSANKEVNIISPFITGNPSALLINALESNPEMHCSIITRFYRADFINGVSQLSALRSLVSAGAEVYAVNGLHTKLYLLDRKAALIGSANFTSGGFKSNIELSLMLENENALFQELQTYYTNMIAHIKDAGNYKLTLDMIANEEQQIATLNRARVKNKSIMAMARNKFRFGANIEETVTIKSPNDSTTDMIQVILNSKSLPQQNRNTNNNTITVEMIETVYSVAKDVFSGVINASQGKQLVNQRLGMNIGSVGNYFQSLRAMLEGTVSKRSISKMATRYFLERIESDYGTDTLIRALESCRKHAEYSAVHGKKVKGIESIVEEFSHRLVVPKT